MAGQDGQVVRVGQGVLRRTAEEEARVQAEILIQCAWPGHQHRRRAFGAATSAAGLLPGGGDGAGVAGQHGGVERADVDAQFQGVGGYHAAHRAVAQPGLDGPPLQRQVAAAVAHHRRHTTCRVGFEIQPDKLIAQIAQQQFHRLAGAGEDDGLHVVGQEGEGHVLGRQHTAGPQPQRRVDDGRVVEDEILAAAWRAVFRLADKSERLFDQSFGVLPRVGDGG